MNFRQLKLRKNPDCPVCGTNPTVTELIDYDQFCGIAPPAPASATPSQEVNGVPQISVTDFKRKQDAGEDIYLLDVREPHEFQIANLGGHLIPLGDLPSRVCKSWTAAARSSSTARWADAARKPPSSSSRRASTKSRISPAAFRPGRSRSIPSVPKY